MADTIELIIQRDNLQKRKDQITDILNEITSDIASLNDKIRELEKNPEFEKRMEYIEGVLSGKIYVSEKHEIISRKSILNTPPIFISSKKFGIDIKSIYKQIEMRNEYIIRLNDLGVDIPSEEMTKLDKLKSFVSELEDKHSKITPVNNVEIIKEYNDFVSELYDRS